MAFELREKNWKLGFTTGPAQKPRERTVTALDQEGFRELFVQNFRSVALAPKIILAFLSSPDGCFMIKRS